MDRLFGFGKPLSLFMSCLALAFVVVATPAIAQTPESQIAQNPIADPPAHVSFVDGTALLERDGQQDSSPTNMPLLAGDRLRTQNGRLEILFADGSTLHLDCGTTIDFQSDELVRLLDGRDSAGDSRTGSSGLLSYRRTLCIGADQSARGISRLGSSRRAGWRHRACSAAWRRGTGE